MQDPRCPALTPLSPPVLLPDGTPFATWEVTCRYTKTYHVAQNHPQASDNNVGSAAEPWKSIQRAAGVLAPGEKVLIHAGMYRETVRPMRGGSGPAHMIGYFAAPGEAVVVSGAEQYRGAFEPADEWKFVKEFRAETGAQVYHARLPREWFVGYLPFGMPNTPQHHLDFGWGKGFPEEPRIKLLLKRGLVFQDGRRLTQVLTLAELKHAPGSYWCESSGLSIYIRPFEDSDPQKSEWEFSTREQAFAPEGTDISFIQLKGLTFQYCADGFTWPQRATVCANGGTHWIIEDCTVQQVNANGIDVGRCHPQHTDHGEHGHHIVRRNTLRDCGICGICATAFPLSNMLVEENHITGAGWHGIERLWECAGIKQHLCKDGLYRRNVIENCLNATGIWLDNGITNTRVTENLIVNTTSGFGGVFIEASKIGRVMVDHNLILGSKLVPPIGAGIGDEAITGGHGIYEHDVDRLLVVHNLIVGCEGSAVMLRVGRVARFIHGRGGVCRDHEVLNNLVIDCQKCVEFGRIHNRADGNAYANPGPEGPWRIHEPAEYMDWEGWREFLKQDLSGVLTQAKATYNASTRVLRLELSQPLPEVERCALGTHDYLGAERSPGAVVPGPFALGALTEWEGNVDLRGRGRVG
ncbi:MAG: right-handed parallel beta-helix repeat-containing protein [Polyangiaceae bacterium]|nr:right-handed parallel beta-helix repeat-containing protein [Polyangiaceae bacterium]